MDSPSPGLAPGAADRLPVWYRVLGGLLRPLLRGFAPDRFGGWPRRTDHPLWLHAASIGEVKGLAAVARRLDIPLIATATTLSGVLRLRRELPEVAAHVAPFDDVASVAAFVEAVDPRGLLLFEAEVWPGWLVALRRRGRPAALAAMRLSPLSARRWERLSRLFPHWPGLMGRVWTQSASDLPIARALGFLRVEAGAPLKWAGVAPLRPSIVADRLAAVSLHRSDLPALARLCRERPGSWLWFPRRPSLVPHLVRLAASLGLRRTTTPAGLATRCVYISETFGEVPRLLPGCRAAYVGGGYRRAGAHDLLEPLFLGVPEVLRGPVRGANPPEEPLDALRARMDATLSAIAAWAAEIPAPAPAAGIPGGGRVPTACQPPCPKPTGG